MHSITSFKLFLKSVLFFSIMIFLQGCSGHMEPITYDSIVNYVSSIGEEKIATLGNKEDNIFLVKDGEEFIIKIADKTTVSLNQNISPNIQSVDVLTQLNEGKNKYAIFKINEKSHKSSYYIIKLLNNGKNVTSQELPEITSDNVELAQHKDGTLFLLEHLSENELRYWASDKPQQAMKGPFLHTLNTAENDTSRQAPQRETRSTRSSPPQAPILTPQKVQVATSPEKPTNTSASKATNTGYTPYLPPAIDFSTNIELDDKTSTSSPQIEIPTLILHQ